MSHLEPKSKSFYKMKRAVIGMAKRGDMLTFGAPLSVPRQKNGILFTVKTQEKYEALIMTPGALLLEDSAREPGDSWETYAREFKPVPLANLNLPDSILAMAFLYWNHPPAFWKASPRPSSRHVFSTFKSKARAGKRFKKDNWDAIGLGNGKAAFIWYGGIKK